MVLTDRHLHTEANKKIIIYQLLVEENKLISAFFISKVLQMLESLFFTAGNSTAATTPQRARPYLLLSTITHINVHCLPKN